jgi:hypothetical protein
VAFEFGGGQGGEILDFHPHPFRAIGRLGHAVDFGEPVEIGRIALEDDGVGEVGVEGDDEKYFTGDLKDEALGPLLHEGRVRQADGKGAKGGEAHGRGQFKMARTAAPRSSRVKGFAR